MRTEKDDTWFDLSKPWWSVHSRKYPVRGALGIALAEYFAPAAFHAIDANSREGRKPCSQFDLANLLGVDRGQMSRMISGEQVFRTHDLIVIAHALHVSIKALIPDLPVLLPRATKHLVGSAATDRELFVYATYRLLIPAATQEDLDEDAVDAAQRAGNVASAKEAKAIIRKVALAVGRKLQERKKPRSAH